MTDSHDLALKKHIEIIDKISKTSDEFMFLVSVFSLGYLLGKKRDIKEQSKEETK